MMLEALGSASLRTLLLALMVQLCLRLLRVRQTQLLLIAWTAVLAASLAMPGLQHVVPITVPTTAELPPSPAVVVPPESPAPLGRRR